MATVPAARTGRDHREGGEVDQLGLEPGLAGHGEQVLDGVPAGSHDDDAHPATLSLSTRSSTW